MTTPARPSDPVVPDSLFGFWCRDHLKELASTTRAARGEPAAQGFDAAAFAEAQVLTVRFADGSELHTSPQDFLAEHGRAGEDDQALADADADDAPWRDEPGRLGDAATGLARGGAEPTPSGRVLLPFELKVQAAAFTRAAGVVGGGGLVVEQYRLARLADERTLDRVHDFSALFADTRSAWFGRRDAPGAAALAGKLCRAYENAVLDRAVGEDDGLLLAWDPASAAWRRADAAGLAAAEGLARRVTEARRVLLLLHGTASSTQGSFGGLWQADAHGAVPADWEKLASGSKPGSTVVLAWEHRSLTASPLVNLCGLVAALRAVPLAPGCVVDMLSHSRGGLVGELLAAALAAGREPGVQTGGQPEAPTDAQPAAAAAQPTEATPPTDPTPRAALIERLRAAYGTDHPDAPQIEPLARALDAVAGSRWQAGIFVRVACPARGTLLADRRTDLFLSLLLRSVGLAFGGPGAVWFELLSGLVRGLVAAKGDARALPGLEAMIPGAPLTVALNPVGGGPVVPGRLRVVAGDAQAQGLGGLLTLLGDVFYGLHDHDYVVHTQAMFGGLKRAAPLSRRVEDPSVTHFGYFKPQAATRGLVLAALQGSDHDFRPLGEDEQRTRGFWQLLGGGEASRRPFDESLASVAEALATGPARPILLVLPGIMGSELSQDGGDGQRVWLSTGALLGGLLRQLRLDGQPALKASGLMPVAYERLLDRAAKRFLVVPWPYDWRQPLFTLGDRLRDDLARLLGQAQAHGVALHVLAHSMGGLVARAALFRTERESQSPLWARLTATGGRLLMLGTPNRGSYAPVQLLLRQHEVANLVSVAASRVDADDLAHFGAGFGGLMTMLPDEPDPEFGDLFAPGTWTTLTEADPQLVPPEPAVLARAAAERAWLRQTIDALKADARVLYVAGQGPTPLGLRRAVGPARDGQPTTVLQLGLSAEGDGTVPWNSTLAPERTWYAPAAHGDLPDHTDAFDAYFELLLSGRTSQLGQQRPATRGLIGTRAIAQRRLLPSLPADPCAYVLGVSPRGESGRWLQPIELRVVHGSLDYARFPLLVGHYLGDGMFGAIRRVDEKLQGQLAQVMALKLFNGSDRNVLYLRPRSTDGQQPPFAGAVVLGLGQVGSLTPSTLAATVTRGVLRYAFEHMHQDCWASTEGPMALRLSTLMLGTHVQAMSPRDCLAGLLQGVWRANQVLAADASLGRRVRMAELEVLEIEGNEALDMAYEVRRLLDRPEWKERFAWPAGVLEIRSGALRGYRPRGQGQVWQRLTVREDEFGGLKFELIAERARVESTQVQSEIASMKAYVDQLCDAGATGESAAAEQEHLGQVLYRMLLPHTLKSRLVNLDRTVLVLDDKSAELPWELLAPGLAGGEGSDVARPLAVQGGLIRQRLTPEFRPVPGIPPGWDVLVIGEPDTGGWFDASGAPLRFNPLPGARQEARQVHALLERDQRPWRVHKLEPGARFERVRTALLDRPWRVLHLAGHGMVNLWVRDVGEGEGRRAVRRTGMVLSNQQILTAGDVEQMDQAPELVFINCCYSGRDASRDTGRETGRDAGRDGTAGQAAGRQLPMLAASLALQFIRMGSKAVVAAGWQVDDHDGITFAERFYEALLEGRRFGEAVLEARGAIWRDGRPRSNTWGAYQCYGDPDWRLIDEGPREAAWDEARSDLLRTAKDCMSTWELAERIERLVGVAGDGQAGQLLRQLDALIADLRADRERSRWLRNSVVRAAISEAYRALGAHRESLTWTLRGLRTAYSYLQFRHLEYAINSLSRLGDDAAEAGHATAQDIVEGLDQLDRLIAPQRLGLEPDLPEEAVADASSERACLLGSAYLRRAFRTTDTNARNQWLLDASVKYAKGYADKRRADDFADRRAYALSNAMCSAGMAGLHRLDELLGRATVDAPFLAIGGQTPTPAATAADPSAPDVKRERIDWQGDTTRLIEEMQRAGPGGTFWHYGNQLDLLVGRAVLSLALGLAFDHDDLDQIKRLADTALVRSPSPVEADSMASRLRQIDQVLDEAVAAAAAKPAVPVAAPAASDMSAPSGVAGQPVQPGAPDAAAKAPRKRAGKGAARAGRASLAVPTGGRPEDRAVLHSAIKQVRRRVEAYLARAR